MHRYKQQVKEGKKNDLNWSLLCITYILQKRMADTRRYCIFFTEHTAITHMGRRWKHAEQSVNTLQKRCVCKTAVVQCCSGIQNAIQ